MWAKPSEPFMLAFPGDKYLNFECKLNQVTLHASFCQADAALLITKTWYMPRHYFSLYALIFFRKDSSLLKSFKDAVPFHDSQGENILSNNVMKILVE